MATNRLDEKIADGRFAIDIRLFLAAVTLAMGASFVAGVALGESSPWTPSHIFTASHPTLLQAHDHQYKAEQPDTMSSDTTEEHLPAGQHLLVDMEGVDGDFLNSEAQLSQAMVDTVKEAGLTMLSYHCHSLTPTGVSCIGVLLESHISFHTWPEDGVITLDLFTCGSNPLLPVVAVIERLFGIGEAVHSQWSHELRGFRPKSGTKHYLDDNSDLSLWVLSPLEVYSKEQIYGNMTKHQRVDIWDIREITDTPTYEDVQKYNLTPGDPRLSSPELATPDRLLFLDGTIQSMSLSENVYHEALVHPAMFAHPAPKQVAILGGGEGATLREVLKHKTLERATMIELDAELVQISRKFLPKMSNCSNFIGRSENCFDDELANVQYFDARAWFVDRFGDAPTIEAPPKFDVIFIDALDSEDETAIADHLYSDGHFINSLLNSLTDDGVLNIQVGTAATIDDPRADMGIYKNREMLFNLLESSEDVAAMLIYEDPHCGFLEPHSFLLVCKSVTCRSRWYARSDQVDYEIYDRIVRTHNKVRALTYFDGTTQRSYQWPKKGWETVYCRREPMPFECAYRTMNMQAELHDFDLENEENSSFRVETHKNESGKIISTKVYATTSIPRGSFVMPAHLASSLQVTTRNLEGLKKNTEVGGGRVAVIQDLLGFFESYAHESAADGSAQHYVELGGSVLIRRVDGREEANVDKWVPNHPSGIRPKYSPVYERNRVSFDVFMVATEDIEEGEEVVMYRGTWQ